MVTSARFGSYEILGELGSGTLATVYKAIQHPLGRKVAIKALKPTISPDSSFAAPLEREARVLADLFHPNICMLLDFVKTDAQMYLVLEYISGYSLGQVLAKKVKLRPEVVCAIGAEIARGLAHVHERGVIHRDIKPANVIIGKYGTVKLVDFGIAHRDRLPTADEPLTESREPLFGTPAYMAPEQLLGDLVMPSADLFSLGVVLYQCIAGVRPFEKDERTKGDRGSLRTRRDPAIPLRSRASDVPRSLERIIMQCLEKAPEDRPISAHALAAELDAFVKTRTEASHADLALSSLVTARLRNSDSVKVALANRTVPPRTRSLRSPWSLLFFTVVLLAGFVAIRILSHGELPNESLREGALGTRLAGEIRVLATPWAEVAVDGQTVDTTPMSRPIRLAPGSHYVTFTHPDAPKETRHVIVESGKSVVLDVAMNVGQSNDAGADAASSKPVRDGGSR